MCGVLMYLGAHFDWNSLEKYSQRSCHNVKEDKGLTEDQWCFSPPNPQTMRHTLPSSLSVLRVSRAELEDERGLSLIALQYV